MVTQPMKRSHLSISKQTKNDLDSIKHPGQSYDGLLKELVKFWEEKHLITETADKVEPQ